MTRHTDRDVVVFVQSEEVKIVDAFPVQPVVTYAHYACVADCADAMADAWEDTTGCEHADCLHGNILKC